jgi:hypothetical protein
MTDQEHKPNSPKRTALDDQLDAALAQYTAIEPRAGLENRVLARLKAQQNRPAAVPWWRWAAVVAVAVIVLTFVVGRVRKVGRDQVVHQSLTPAQEIKPEIEANATSTNRHKPGGSSIGKPKQQTAQVAAAPIKLEQFPSPRPLSQQEEILAEYVANYPEHAALIAEARTEVLRREAKEQSEPAKGGVDHSPEQFR